MPQIGWFEILIIVAISIVVIGPKDFPFVLKKIGSFSHGEHNKPEFANLKSIEENIRMKKNIFGLKFSYRKIDIDHTFPKYIIDNKEKFKEWII